MFQLFPGIFFCSFVILFLCVKECRSDSALLSSTDAAALKEDAPGDYRKFLDAAPQSISLIGQLMVLSSGDDDFSLDAVPEGGFVFMKFSGSFSATLAQVTDSAKRALTNAESKMQAIKSAMENTPQELQESIKIIYNMNVGRIKHNLPLKIKSVQRSFRVAQNSASEISGEFESVKGLIQEVVLALQASQRIQQTKIRRITARMKHAQKKGEASKQMLEEIKKRGDRLEKEVKSRKAAYDKAVKDIPSSWERVAQDLVQGLTKGLAKLSDSLVPGLEAFDFNGNDQQGGQAAPEAGAQPMSEEQMRANDEKQKNVQAYCTLATTLMSALNELDGAKDELFSYLDEEHEEGDNENHLERLHRIFKEIPVSTFKKQSALLPEGHQKTVEMNADIDKMEKIAKELEAFAKKQVTVEQKDKSSVEDRLTALLEKMEPVAIGEVLSRGGPSEVDQTLPGVSAKGKQLNEEFVAQMQQQALKMSKQRQDRNQELREKQEMKVVKLSNMIKGMAERKADAKKIMEVMIEATVILANLNEQWSMMTMYFNGLSKLGEHLTADDVGTFVKSAKTIQKIRSGEIEDPKLMNETVVQLRALAIGMQSTASTLRARAVHLHQVSSVIVKVSSEFIVPKLAGLTSVLSASSKGAKMAAISKLRDYENKACTEIKRIAREEKARVDKLRAEWDAKLEKASKKAGVPLVPPAVVADSINSVDDLGKAFGMRKK